MKILYIVPNPGREGGVSRSIARVTDALVALGVPVEVFCPDFEALADKKKSPMDAFYSEMRGEEMQTWTHRCLEKIEEVKPDLIVGYFGRNAAFCAVAAAKLKRIPVVASLRGNDVNLDFFSAMYGGRVAFTIENASRVTTVSNEMKSKVKAWYGVEATFVPNSVDKQQFYHDVTGALELKKEWGLDDRPVVALLGEFKHARGLPLLEALEPELANAQTLIIGTVRKKFQSQVPSWVKQVPYIRDLGTLRAAYSLCDIVLQPSLYDGMPNVVLEAMACERTVLASPVGGLKDLIRDGQNGYLCPTTDDWKLRVRELIIENPPQLGRQAREDITDPAQEAASFLKIFHEVYGK